jgi:DNA-binding MarR family transcriptional regulator
MPPSRRNQITREQWDEAAASYELGERHAVQIARDLGVSPATVSREFTRRGCVKASRIAETITAIEARLDAEAKAKAEAELAADAARRRALAVLVDELFDAFDAAKLLGQPIGDSTEVHRIGRELQRLTR